MKAHFVTFLSPGTLFAEDTTKPIDAWDINKAQKMAHEIVERHGATPFAFYFTTRSRTPKQLDSVISATSCKYYLGGKVETLKDVESRKDPKEEILLSNMKCNGWKSIITNTNSWRITQPFFDKDMLLDWKPKKSKAKK